MELFWWVVFGVFAGILIIVGVALAETIPEDNRLKSICAQNEMSSEDVRDLGIVCIRKDGALFLAKNLKAQ